MKKILLFSVLFAFVFSLTSEAAPRSRFAQTKSGNAVQVSHKKKKHKKHHKHHKHHKGARKAVGISKV